MVYLQLLCETKIIQKLSDEHVIKIRCLETHLVILCKPHSDKYVIRKLIEGST